MRVRGRSLALTGLLAACLGGCGDVDPALLAAVREASAPALFAPAYDGDAPRSFTVDEVDHAVMLDYGAGFSPTLTLRRAPDGDLCARRQPDWDRCTTIDEDAVRLSFEEMDAVVVRRDGTELFWSNLSFEMADEESAGDAEQQAAIEERVSGFVDAARSAEELTPAELVDRVPGTVGAAG